jgi:HEAT repeat protein
LLLVAFAGICLSIRSGVKEIARTALHHYPGDRVEALMEYAESPDHSLSQRNLAVWALGQIGDKRALPLLEKHKTGKPCDHDSALCQHEVAKAIDACNGAFNATAWLPR